MRIAVFAVTFNFMQNPESYSPKSLLDLTGGDVPFVVELLETYLVQTRAAVLSIKKSGAEKNWDEIKFAAHKLRSASGSVGANRIGAACAEIENYLNTHNDVEKGVYLYLHSFIQTVFAQLSEIEKELEKMRES